jgi:hypothetical protein
MCGVLSVMCVKVPNLEMGHASETCSPKKSWKVYVKSVKVNKLQISEDGPPGCCITELIKTFALSKKFFITNLCYFMYDMDIFSQLSLCTSWAIVVKSDLFRFLGVTRHSCDAVLQNIASWTSVGLTATKKINKFFLLRTLLTNQNAVLKICSWQYCNPETYRTFLEVGDSFSLLQIKRVTWPPAGTSGNKK